jgi:hypothetical protein
VRCALVFLASYAFIAFEKGARVSSRRGHTWCIGVAGKRKRSNADLFYGITPGESKRSGRGVAPLNGRLGDRLKAGCTQAQGRRPPARKRSTLTKEVLHRPDDTF